MSIRRYGTGFYLVDSHTRQRLEHLVDLFGEFDDRGEPIRGGLPYVCNCESYHYGNRRPCRHILEVLEAILDNCEIPNVVTPPRKKRRSPRKRKPKPETITV